LLVAPFNLRAGIIRMVEAERRRALRGLPALIRMKLNDLVDQEIIESLYAAAQAGVQIDLVIRGMCTLQAGVPGVSDTIRVRSILGRFLEHSRVMQFGVGRRAQIWIGSADVRHRNLDHRIEVMVQVRDAKARRAVCDVLDLAMSSHIDAWDLQPDAGWVRRAEATDHELLDYQEQLIHHYQKRSLRLVTTVVPGRPRSSRPAVPLQAAAEPTAPAPGLARSARTRR
jgi:polyphosphate kinase